MHGAQVGTRVPGNALTLGEDGAPSLESNGFGALDLSLIPGGGEHPGLRNESNVVSYATTI
jgi:hypothetical protein